MHDIAGLEAEGIPGVFIATTEFIRAAEVQANAIGMPDVKVVYLPHPIQDRTDDEMRALARASVDEIIGSLTV